jgi:hypothetical protein
VSIGSHAALAQVLAGANHLLTKPFDRHVLDLMLATAAKETWLERPAD